MRTGLATMTVVITAAALVLAAGAPASGSGRGGATTTRVSVSSTGLQGQGDSWQPRISADGRYVVFRSAASNLAPEAGDSVGLYVRDRWTGTTTLVYSGEPVEDATITPDGRYIAFQTLWTIQVLDRSTGAFTIEALAGSGELNELGSPQLSADGQRLAFWSRAADLVPGDTNGDPDVFVRDRRTGTTERISVSTTGEQGNGPSFEASISDDGRYVAFTSHASNLAPEDGNNDEDNPYVGLDVFVRDLRTGTTTLASVLPDGSQSTGWGAAGPALSANGRYVAFLADEPTLNPDGPTYEMQAFVRDRSTATTERVTVSATGAPANASAWNVQVSDNGRYVAYSSSASNLVPDDTNEADDIFVRDRRTATTTRISVGWRGTQGNGASLNPTMTADGHAVAFQSAASNLVRRDSNGLDDVFVRDMRR